MLQVLSVAYLDASAAQLSWSLDAPVRPALASRRLQFGDLALDLRLLGASHQVVFEAAGHRGTELVACDRSSTGGLPREVGEERGRFVYRFTSHVERLEGAPLAALAEELVARLSVSERALVGAFPGSPHAVTAISADGEGWRTWHLYPQAGEVVRTATVIEVA